MPDRKRKLPPKMAAMKARKRRRVNGEDEPSSASKAQSRVAMKPDQLPWKAMDMPERLDDWEGINGGIEEIEDVEVVRDEQTGKVSFTVKASAAHAKQGSQPQPHGAANGADAGEEESKTGDDEEEWSGFDDDVNGYQLRPVSPTDFSKSKTRPKHGLNSVGARAGDEGTNGHGINDSLSALSDDDHDDADVSAWKELKLSPDTLAALSKLKFSRPTPIQTAAVPQILDGKDVIGKASTGSGKTLAFGIPILEQFLENRFVGRNEQDERFPLALILSPTRELAHQIDKHLTALCANVISGGPSIATLTGGLSVQKQQRLLKDADIVIGTPGRLWEIISLGQEVSMALREVQFLVVDEADRLLSEGHFKEVEEILNFLERQDVDDEDSPSDSHENGTKPDRQTLIFSATFDRGLQKKLASKSRPGGDLTSNKNSLAYLLTKLNFRTQQPEFIDVNPVNQLATGLTEELVQCEGTEKDLYLYTLLFDRLKHRTLVFANSIDAVRRLTPLLQNLNLNALALHSEMPQKARLRSVERFTQAKSGSGSILIATDVAARGLDIPGVQTVIHYHLPRTADTYVHRSGRTARAGQKGSSIIICSAKEAAGVRRLIASIHAQSAVHSSANEAAKQGFYIRTLEPERRTLTQLKPRVKLAKRIADTTLSKQKQSKSDDALRAGAEELGQEYDSEEFEAQASKGKQGRGKGRKKREKEASRVTKAEMGAMRAELKGMVAERVNSGWSPKYLTAGGIDVDALLREREAAGMI